MTTLRVSQVRYGTRNTSQDELNPVKLQGQPDTRKWGGESSSDGFLCALCESLACFAAEDLLTAKVAKEGLKVRKA